jgi:hypothetical protein
MSFSARGQPSTDPARSCEREVCGGDQLGSCPARAPRAAEPHPLVSRTLRSPRSSSGLATGVFRDGPGLRPTTCLLVPHQGSGTPPDNSGMNGCSGRTAPPASGQVGRLSRPLCGLERLSRSGSELLDHDVVALDEVGEAVLLIDAVLPVKAPPRPEARTRGCSGASAYAALRPGLDEPAECG